MLGECRGRAGTFCHHYTVSQFTNADIYGQSSAKLLFNNAVCNLYVSIKFLDYGNKDPCRLLDNNYYQQSQLSVQVILGNLLFGERIGLMGISGLIFIQLGLFIISKDKEKVS